MCGHPLCYLTLTDKQSEKSPQHLESALGNCLLANISICIPVIWQHTATLDRS